MGRPPLSVASVAISYVCLPVRSARVACFSVQFADGSMTRAMSWMPTCLGDDSDRRCFGSPFSPCRRFFLESRPHRATSGRNLIDHAFLGKGNVRTRSTLLPRRRSERDAHARISCHRRPSSFARPREPFAHPVVSIHARVRGGVRGGHGRRRPLRSEGFRRGGSRAKKRHPPYTWRANGRRSTRPPRLAHVSPHTATSDLVRGESKRQLAQDGSWASRVIW